MEIISVSWLSSYLGCKVAKKLAFDMVLFTAVVVLVALGLVMVESASTVVTDGHQNGFSRLFTKQILAVGLGLIAMLVVMHIDYRKLGKPMVFGLLVLAVVTLLIAVLFGPTVNGTRRWILLAGFSLQPSELAKFVGVIFMAVTIHRTAESERDRDLLFPALLVPGVFVALILLEADLGTAIVIAAITGLMLFLGGLRWRYVLPVAAGAPLFAYFLVQHVEYQKDRLTAFLHPENDPLGHAWQVKQSLIAIGSGGLWGLGPGESLQKLYFLPFPYSDFLYAIVGEELGFIGAVAVVLLFGVFAWRGIRAGTRAQDLLGRHLAWGITAVIVLQALLHVSVALSLAPTTGITLPLMSYGGSSMVVTLAACGVLLNVSQHG